VSSVLQSDLVTIALLAIEPFLLAATLLLLILNRREQKGRDRLLERLSAATDVVSRQEYFVAVLGSLQSAKESVSGSVTGSPPTTEEGEILHQVTEAISAASSRGVRVRYLLPLAPDRLHVAQLYTAAGAEVKLNPGVLVTDARYMIVDGRSVVVGVPERKGRDEPTRKGYVVPSETVAGLFKGDFDSKWASSETKTFKTYLSELVTSARASNPSISSELIASNLKIDRKAVDSVLAETA